MSEIIVAGLLRLDDWRTSRSCTSSTAGTLLAMRDGVLPPTINVDEPDAADISASLLAMRDGVVPPTINVEVPDPNCDLDYVTDNGRKVHRTPARKKTAGARRKTPAGLVRGNSDLSAGPSRKKWPHSQLLTSL